jgi:hypothetical protein
VTLCCGILASFPNYPKKYTWDKYEGCPLRREDINQIIESLGFPQLIASLFNGLSSPAKPLT